MPALNEEENLPAAVQDVLDAFHRLEITGEIIVVDDGSTDRTGTIADRLAADHEGLRVIHHRAAMGIGASFWDGVRCASGDVVVMLPGDGENAACEIFRYLPLMDHVDMVVPFVHNRQVRSFKRRLLSIVYREIIKASFGLSLNYMNGTVMYRRCILKDMELENPGFFYQSELLIRCIRRGYLYAEVPYALRLRSGGDSKATTLRSLAKVMCGYMGMVREVMTTSPGTVAPGSATFKRIEEWQNGTADS
jgi:glycosyltransferase involved in cell wall biosynthesis